MENLIINSSVKKHVKIYKLKQLGKSNKDIALLLSTNQGHVYNVLKKYNEKEELKIKSNAIDL